MFNKLTVLFATLTFSASAHAVLIDFTADNWSGAHAQATYSQVINSIGVTITAEPTNELLTFNSGDRAGCAMGSASNEYESYC